MATIANGSNTPLNQHQGTVPNVGGAMLDWFQAMVFGRVVKQTVGFRVVETYEPVNFFGVIQPLSGRELSMKPQGQQSWNWIWVHAQPELDLTTDEIIRYLDIQYRVMGKKNYTNYGYVSYELVQDYTGSGPTPV